MYAELSTIKALIMLNYALFKELSFILCLMIKKEMIDKFGFDRSTLNNWENGTKEKRKVLYAVLEALPIDFVENVKQSLDDKKKNEELLK